jgi:predicted ATPase/class 3 adenylate cyclase
VHNQTEVATILFTDIEGSARLWETQPDAMRLALARHDAIARSAVEANRGILVKTTGDGVHAAFADPLNAVLAALQMQLALQDRAATHGIELRVRCGMHTGVPERRDNDFHGAVVNRAARIMAVAHGGQVLISQAAAVLVRDRLPAGASLRDLGLVRLRDLAYPEQICQLEHVQLRRNFPALRTLEATPNNLPQQITTFIGREREQAELRALLGRSRLLTLVGAGGLGKTRLSLQVAAEVMDDYPDGVWLVELAPLTDPARVPQAVATVLGVKEDPERAHSDALIRHLAGRRVLLVLDNCEHLVHACAELAKKLLEAGPDLKILASSRENLHVAGEAIYPLQSLSLPDPRAAATLAGLARCEAVQMFVDRAMAAQPAFSVTRENATAVADICQRLDGIPLALELAAARVRALPVEKIATRLDDCFRLLTGGDRTALPRQQTLRALIDWSYELLTPHERTLLWRLAVFVGGWTLEAVEAVGAGGAIDQTEVLDLLTRLIEKSLVVPEADGERYRLLETVRQYALERLEESGEGDAVRARHLAFHVALAESARPELVGPRQGAWLARLDLDRENLLSAHAWCERAEDGAQLDFRLLHAVQHYWINRGLLVLAYKLMLEALARDDAQARDLARCGALFDAGWLGCYMARYPDAKRHLEEALAIARESGHRAKIAMVLQPLSLALLGQGEVALARAMSEEALALARELGNPRDVLAALNALAQLDRGQGELDRAEPRYADVLALARRLGDRESTAIALLNLAMVAIARGSLARAAHMLREVHAIVREIGSKPAGQSLLDVAAGLCAVREDWLRAARHYGAAEAVAEETGYRRDPADEAFLAPLVAKARSACGAPAFATAEAAGRALSYVDAMRDVEASLAENG